MKNEQVKLVSDKEEVKKIEQELGVEEATLEETPEIAKIERPTLSIKDVNIGMKNHALVTGNLEEKTLQLKVVSVFDLSTANDLPDQEMLENEIDVWRQQLLAYINNNSDMIRKAVSVLVR